MLPFSSINYCHQLKGALKYWFDVYLWANVNNKAFFSSRTKKMFSSYPHYWQHNKSNDSICFMLNKYSGVSAMKRIFSFFTIAILAGIIFSCSRPGDTLVSFTNGSISRKDFYEWLTINHYDLKAVTKSKDQQKPKLLSLAIERISNDEAKKAGFNQQNDISVITDISRKKIVSQEFLEKKVFTDSKETETVVISESLLFRKKDKKVKSPGIDSLSLALNDLSKCVSFAEVSRKYADGLWVVKGSSAVTRAYMVKEYGTAALALKKGEYTKIPVVSESGTYIIFARDKKKLSLSDAMANKKEDGIPYQLIASLIRDKEKNDYIVHLSSKADAPLNENALLVSDKKAVLFSVKGKTMTVADFDILYSVFTAHAHRNAPETLNERKKFLKDIYDITLIYDEALRTNFVDSELTSKTDRLCESMISREYIMSIVAKKVTVADKDIQSEITLHQGKKNSSRIRDRKESYESIRKQLLDRAITNDITKWKEEKLKEYNVSINDRALEGK